MAFDSSYLKYTPTRPAHGYQPSIGALNGALRGGFRDLQETPIRKDAQTPVSTRRDPALSTSYASPGTSFTHASVSSSKAVLAALRALQEKIKKLETERLEAQEEAAQLRAQLRQYEEEDKYRKQKEQSYAHDNLIETRSTIEQLTFEKQELEQKLQKAEQDNKALSREIDRLRDQLDATMQVKEGMLPQVRDAEARISVLEQEVRSSQEREKELASTILEENRHHQQELDAMQQRIAELHNKLISATEEKQDAQNAKTQMDNLIAQLLSINESLIKQLAEQPGFQMKSRRLAASTASAYANRHAAMSPQRARRTATSSATKTATSTAKKVKKKKVSTKDPTDLLAAMTKAVSKQDRAGQLKALHALCASIADQVKTSRTASPAKKKATKAAATSTQTRLSVRMPSTTRHDVSNVESSYYDSPLRGDLFGAQDGELDDIIASLENEFDTLTRRYRSLLSTLHDSSDIVSSPSRTDDLRQLLQQLKTKGAQLRAVRQRQRNQRQL